MADARTARDEAIAAIVRAFDEHRGELDIYDAMRDTLEAAGYEPFFEYALDAIPNDVLARYVQERGAVIDVVIAGDDWRAYDLADTPDGRSGAEQPPTIALYRLATEDE
jgi:hypothetical protein